MSAAALKEQQEGLAAEQKAVDAGINKIISDKRADEAAAKAFHKEVQSDLEAD